MWPAGYAIAGESINKMLERLKTTAPGGPGGIARAPFDMWIVTGTATRDQWRWAQKQDGDRRH
jgi:hypothetical protein